MYLVGFDGIHLKGRQVVMTRESSHPDIDIRTRQPGSVQLIGTGL
jgi:hypothetical protein